MTRLLLQSSQIIRAKVELIQPKKRSKTEIPTEDDLIVESLFLDENEDDNEFEEPLENLLEFELIEENGMEIEE